MWFKLIFLVLNFMTQIYCTPHRGSIQPQPSIEKLLEGNANVNLKRNANVNLKSQTILDQITETAAKCPIPILKHSSELDSCNRPLVPSPPLDQFISDDLTLCIGIFDAVGHLCQKNNTEFIKQTNETKTDDICKDISSTLPDSPFEPTKEWEAVLHNIFGDVKKCKRACIHDKGPRGIALNPLCLDIFRINTILMNVEKQKILVKSDKVSGGTANPKSHQVTDGISKENPNASRKTMKPQLSTGSGVEKATSDDYLTEQNKSVKVVDTMAPSALDSTKPSSFEALTRDITTGIETDETPERNFEGTEQEQFPTGGEPFQNEKISEEPSPPMVQHTNNNTVTSTVGKEPVITKNNDLGHMTQGSNKIEPSVPNTQVPGKTDNSSVSATLNMPPTILPESDVTSRKGSNKTTPDVNGSKEETEKLSDEDLLTDEATDKMGTSNFEDTVPDNVQSQEIQGNQEIGGGDENKAFVPSHFVNAEDSHFFAYFVTMTIFCVVSYLVFHNKQKILALALEGRSRRGTRRRPNTSGYRKLDSNLEEAVTSTCSTSVTHVIY